MQSVMSFHNLSKDATLVVPLPRVSESRIYIHLANFLRHAPKHQKLDLWRLALDELLQKIETHPNRPVWLSTSGLGVSWLHIRLDSAPKYYTHTPYRSLHNA